MKRLSSWKPRLFAAALLADMGAAQAQESIGVAVTIRNDVKGTVALRTIPINAGEDVFRKEVVRTAQDSSAKLVFADNTNLAVGPQSTVMLDKFVYSGATDYKKATVRLVKGAFRFATGKSDKRAYEINTDVATIGVRGTVVDILSQPGRTIAVLQEGVVLACSKNLRCTTLSRPGETAVITATSAANKGVGGAGGWSFASACIGEPSLCEATTLALNEPPAGEVVGGGAVVTALQGPVFVNRGAGFVRLAANAQLAPTDRVMANPGSEATLSYSGGCVKRVTPGAVVTVGTAAQCWSVVEGRPAVVPPPAPPPPAEAEACRDAYGNFDPTHCPALGAVGAVGLVGLVGLAGKHEITTVVVPISRPISP